MTERMASMGKYTNQKTGITFTYVIPGKLNEKDKHWGMRSNKNLRKILEKEAAK